MDRRDTSVSAAEEDLSLVLGRLMSYRSNTRKKRETRRGIANDLLTKEYLEAGLRLIVKEFAPVECESGDDAEENDRTSAFFDWLSYAKVIDEVNHAGRQQGGMGSLRYRWEERDDYIEDLLAYSLWAKSWKLHLAAAAKSRISLLDDADLVHAVHESAYSELSAVLGNRTVRLQLLASAIAERYPDMKAEMGETYRQVHAEWIPNYELTFKSMALSFGPMSLSKILPTLYLPCMRDLRYGCFLIPRQISSTMSIVAPSSARLHWLSSSPARTRGMDMAWKD